jgi:hypothetical protein
MQPAQRENAAAWTAAVLFCLAMVNGLRHGQHTALACPPRQSSVKAEAPAKGTSRPQDPGVRSCSPARHRVESGPSVGKLVHQGRKHDFGVDGTRELEVSYLSLRLVERPSLVHNQG